MTTATAQFTLAWGAGDTQVRNGKVDLGTQPGDVQVDTAPRIGVLRAWQLPSDSTVIPFLAWVTGADGARTGPINLPLTLPVSFPTIVECRPQLGAPSAASVRLAALTGYMPASARYSEAVALGASATVPSGAALLEGGPGTWWEWIDSTGAVVSTGAGIQAVDPRAATVTVLGAPSVLRWYYGGELP